MLGRSYRATAPAWEPSSSSAESTDPAANSGLTCFMVAARAEARLMVFRRHATHTCMRFGTRTAQNLENVGISLWVASTWARGRPSTMDAPLCAACRLRSLAASGGIFAWPGRKLRRRRCHARAGRGADRADASCRRHRVRTRRRHWACVPTSQALTRTWGSMDEDDGRPHDEVGLCHSLLLDLVQ